jgi:hypothetical protein
MPQQTNLNTSPYFDDFDSNDNYYKVLFKPEYPVQARELTGLQSILQNQIERFGQHFFKEGAKVIPGNTAYTQSYYAVQLNNTYLGVPVDSYVNEILKTKIIGLTSGVTAVVDKILLSEDSEKGNLTLYVAYLSSSTSDNSSEKFVDGELLVSEKDISTGVLGNTLISSGQPFASLISTNATSTGSAFSVSNGVYFVRGTFVNVNDETLILDQYSNTPSYRIGFFVDEEIVNSDIDERLTDNSKGFNNYAAPGADRLKITCKLAKKPLDDFNDSNFIELATVQNGIIKTQIKNTTYNIVADELARRTYAESGDYCVNSFDINVKESLNNDLGNNGIFKQGQLTYGGVNSSDDLLVYKLSPGKAFVKGYEIETISPTFLDAPKPRTTKILENQAINYVTGSTLRLNRVFGSAQIGIGNTYVLSLRDSRVGISSLSAAGKEIGLARVYDFRLESGSYNASNSNLNEWNISLYDVQTVSEITLNEPITLTTPTFIKGKYSGATAFLKNSISTGTAVTVYQKNGEFVVGEPFIFDGIENTRVSIAVTSYGIGDIKSVFYNGGTGLGVTFSADTVQTNNFFVGIATITPFDGVSGISTIISSNPLFPGKIASVGNIVKFNGLSLPEPIFAKIVSVGSTSVNVTGLTTVPGICQGKLPTSSNLSVTDLTLVTTKLEFSEDNTLYTSFPKSNIEKVDLENTTLTIRKSFTVNISANKLSTSVNSGVNETFLPFDEERYTLIRSNGETEVLTSDKFSFANGSTQLQIYNLGSNDTGATLIVTLSKIKPKSKVKLKKRINAVVIDRSKNLSSGIGATTLNDGLTYGKYPYGTRVQDENISLNDPDIMEVLGVYESYDISNPSPPKASLSSISGPSGKTTDLIIGEKLIGKTSGAIAIYAERLSDSQIVFISKNDFTFKEGEIITFEESKIQAIVSTLETPSINVSANFTFNNGQKGTHYDYGYLTRKTDAKEPTRKLKVYFSNGYYESSDDGDITTTESYKSLNYTNDIQSVNGVRNTDIIDIRPRVSTYQVSENSRSPLEFYGRLFNSSGNSAANILASDESIVIDYSFYLGRIDRIYLTKEGKFQIQYGDPAEKPEKPISVDNALEIGFVTLPPYLYNVSQASISFLENKRYRMSDIKKLEDRIKNLEYYTSLSLLETNTSNLFIPDTNGLNRFKSGFFVDNFTSLLPQETKVEIKNSLDIANKELRPRHYTNSIDLTLGPVLNTNPSSDFAFTNPEGTNIRRSGDIITLDYTEVEWLKQTFATRTESVTPFLISFWQASMELTPSSDTWVDTARIEAKIINAEGNFAETMAEASRTMGVDPQTGFSPVLWNSWETVWTGQEVVNTSSQRTVSNSTQSQSSRGVSGSGFFRGQWRGGLSGAEITTTTTTTTNVVQDNFREVIDTGVSTRTGVRTIITEQFDQTSVGDRVVSRDLIAFMRSRNIEFKANKLKPLTQIYAFFDGIDVTRYCTPKLLEISMISGVFQVGETVVGYLRPTGLGENWRQSIPGITFRVAQANHKNGPYDAPTEIYKNNPYLSQTGTTSVQSFLGTTGTVQTTGQGQVLPASYSSTSTILNVDTFSLSNQAQGEFSGYVQQDMILVGKNSGAQATVSSVRLVSDLSASLIGSFFIPNPNTISNPKFQTGSKVFTLINSSVNDRNFASTIAEEGFSSSGTLETVQENIISVRNARVEKKQETEQQGARRTTGAQFVSSNIISSQTTSNTSSRTEWYDPLAQSFTVEDETGVFITKCDVFFKTKDDMDIPITFQIRTMQNGVPTQKILPFSEIILNPDQINVSQDGSVATTFTFKSPVYLEGNADYAICLASWSTKYSVFISRIGEPDILTNEFISNQPYLGSLFKSQNAATWDASQWEDLKFTLYRAEFLTTGTLEIYNPELSSGNGQIPTLMPDSINLVSRSIRVGLGSTVQDSGLQFGNVVLQQGTNATGKYVGSAGIATGTLNVINAGIGYTPSSGSFTFNNVNLVNITGTGKNATANVSISNGVAVAATISNSGFGYKVGDVLGITTIGNISVGQNIRLSVVSIASTNELLLDNVQGDFVVGVANTIQYINSLGVTTTLNASIGGNVQISNIEIINDGLHFEVNHKNHGMYHETNRVTISNVQPDVLPTKLTSSYSSTSTNPITVADSSNFSTFENVGVGTTNVGYALIGDEVISYSSVSSGTLSGITRGSNSKDYPLGTPIYKYEVGGVSLRRINKTHLLDDVTVSNPITFDSYYIKLDMSSSGVARTDGLSFPNLYINNTKSTGGPIIKASQNMPFESITPMIQNITVQGTSVKAQVRTITGSSISGNEVPFVNKGYESVTLNKINYFDSSRIVCSKINETNKLVTLPGNKSLNIKLTLDTVDTRLTPVIDTQRMSAILVSNRVNNVISDYAKDNRVNSIFEDPTAFQYISKEIKLENPATSIKIIANAHINLYSDIRAFYSISEKENFDPIFVPFPGWDNLDSKKQIISFTNSNGKSDSYVSNTSTLGFDGNSLEYKEYTFTSDLLPSFRSYRIKLVMTSTNQAYVPRLKDLRVITLA